MKGDSGAWVIDAATGELYGHLVAGLFDGRAAYLVTAYKIFEDISGTLGSVEFLPKQTPAKRQTPIAPDIDRLSARSAEGEPPRIPSLRATQTVEGTSSALDRKGMRNAPKITAEQEQDVEDTIIMADLRTHLQSLMSRFC